MMFSQLSFAPHRSYLIVWLLKRRTADRRCTNTNGRESVGGYEKQERQLEVRKIPQELEKQRETRISLFFFFGVGLLMWWADVLWGPVLFTFR